MFLPNVQQFATVIRLQHRVITDVYGQKAVSYTDASPAVHYCNFKPFFGSEALQAGVQGITDGGTVTMWYDQTLTVRDRILLDDDPQKAYEIISAENVEHRNRFLVLKVRRMVNA